MRIIAGKYKSRRLKLPKKKSIRPTMDRVKETLFNVIGQDISGKHVLDLCAGCGSLGFEALSRGAQSVCFVDNDPSAIQCIKHNAELLKAEDLVTIIKKSVLIVVPLLKSRNKIFDYILFDPPYRGILTKKTLMKLNQFDILAPCGKIIIEHSAHENITELERFEYIMSKEFGETRLTFLGSNH